LLFSGQKEQMQEKGKGENYIPFACG